MSSEIKRWDVQTMDERTSSDGKWVLHSDHEAEVARLRVMAQEQGVKDGNEIGRLRAELQNAAKAALDATALACEKEREADALRRGIGKALDELEDAGPKALKYAAQELRAAMGEGK